MISAELNDLLVSLQRQYQRDVNRDLSRQHADGLLKRNFLKATNNLLEAVPPQNVNELQHLKEAIEALLQQVLKLHRSSCAISNFPKEHQPDKEYISAVINAAYHKLAKLSLSDQTGK